MFSVTHVRRHPLRPSLRHPRIIVGIAAALTAACSDNPAKPIEGAGDPENISRVTVSLTPVGSTTAIISVRVDPDGTQLPQPVGAAQGTLALAPGTTYNGSMGLLNDIDPNNIVNITNEVRKEQNFHRFFYTLNGSCTGVSVPTSSLDLDEQSPTRYPVGLLFQVVVAAAAPPTTNCTLNVQLHHFEENKGDGLGSTYDTDLSIDFPVTVR